MHAPTARMPFKIHDENANIIVKRGGKSINGKLSSFAGDNHTQLKLPLSDAPLTKQKSITDISSARQSNRKALSNLSTSQVNSRLTNSITAEASKFSKANSDVSAQHHVVKTGTGPSHVLLTPSVLISNDLKVVGIEAGTQCQAFNKNLSEGKTIEIILEESGNTVDFTEEDMVCSRMTDDEDAYDRRLRQVMADRSLLFKIDDQLDIPHHFPPLMSSPEALKEFNWDNNRDEYETEQYVYDAETISTKPIPMEEALMDLSSLL